MYKQILTECTASVAPVKDKYQHEMAFSLGKKIGQAVAYAGSWAPKKMATKKRYSNKQIISETRSLDESKPIHYVTTIRTVAMLTFVFWIFSPCLLGFIGGLNGVCQRKEINLARFFPAWKLGCWFADSGSDSLQARDGQEGTNKALQNNYLAKSIEPTMRNKTK